MIEIKMYSAIGEPTHFLPDYETPEHRLPTPRDQAFDVTYRFAEAMRNSEVSVSVATSGAGSLSLLLKDKLTSRQCELLERYFPLDRAKYAWEILQRAGAI